MIKFDFTSVPLNNADLDEVEQRFSFEFPQPVRAHYLRYNGGHPDKDRFSDENGTCIVHDFFPIKISAVSTLPTLETIIRRLKVDQRLIPDHLVPFADDPFGNIYCFSTRGHDFGAIYWLKMEGRRKPGGEFIARSFVDLMAGLRSKELR
jgi:SMI1 / KNR4 family (SUKH-1)